MMHASLRANTVDDLMDRLPARQIIDVNGLPISYRVMGQGSPVLFLHGLLGSADSWVFQLLGLSSRHQIISWDAPGYGQSAGLEPDLDMFAEQLRGFISALGLRTLTLVGHSMGGTLAARVAADPSPLMDKLVLSCTHPGYAAPEGTPPTQKLLDRMKALKEEGAVVYGRSRAEAMVASPADPFILDVAAHVAAGTNPDGLFVATRMLQFADLRPFYQKITVPTRVFFGERDPVVRPDLSEELRTLTPNATHVTLPNVGHAPYLEDAGAYADALGPFMD